MKKNPATLHDVYWGSHGCAKRRGHKGGCRCDCKVWLPVGVNVYGSEKDTAIAVHAIGKKKVPMLKPICITHMREMTVTVTGANVHYPRAQYIYNGDIWICPTEDCTNEIFLRAFTPAMEGFHPEYQSQRELALQMWDL